LLSFSWGTLDDATAEEVCRHLDTCHDCCRHVAELTNDPFLERLRAALSTPSSAAEATPLPEALETEAPATRLPDSPSGAESLTVAGLPPELRDHPEYDVERELGRGGMGVVYLATNKLMQRREVLKVMKQSLVDEASVAERFLREIRAGGQLRHPNIVTTYTAFHAGELMVLAMEYVEGEDLAKLIRVRGPLPVAEACSYARHGALGLQHAFERHVVHRDIKPENLILSSKDGDRIVKILDMGLAKAVQPEKVDYSLTGSGRVLGSPWYMAPEQTEDAAAVDIRADVYSLGCTLYFLLTGGPPFPAKGLYEVLHAHRTQQAPSLCKVRPDVPAKLAAVVDRMMAKSPAKRYQTPAEVARALAPFAASGEAVKPTHTIARRVGAAVAAAVLLAFLALWMAGVFKLKTREGILVIETNEPSPEIYVDGEKVTVTWDDGGKKAEIRVRPGTRKVEVKKDGLSAYGEEVTLEEGGRTIVTARLQKPPPQTKRPPKKDDGLPPGSVWKGKRTYRKGWYQGTTVPYELYIRQRDGSRFKGDKFDNGPGRNFARVEGEIQGDSISWEEQSGHLRESVTHVKGRLQGTIIRLEFTHDWDGRRTIEGDGELKRE
jgi:tRNA A-37 threonylcarbamoyl transferase component Bud32